MEYPNYRVIILDIQNNYVMFGLPILSSNCDCKSELKCQTPSRFRLMISIITEYDCEEYAGDSIGA